MTDIKDLLKEELIKELSGLNIEKFRAEQALDWIYKKFIYDFDKMSNLSAEARSALKGKFYISVIKSAKESISKDGTIKFLFGLEDGETIESVFIPSKNTSTVCVSSQAGCKFACGFCASGKNGFARNLRPAEMVNQVLYIKRGQFSDRELSPNVVSNIVFMGMGEPFDNYDNVLKAARILNAPYGLNIGQRKITISTCGIIPGIKRLAKEDLQIELSISLHGASDEVRSGLMAVNRRYPIKELMAACREYIKETNRQVTFEYVLIKGVNDSLKDAEALAKLLRGMIAKVNLIPLNPVEDLEYAPPEPRHVKMFKGALDKKGVTSVIRTTRGSDIAAACGQLTQTFFLGSRSCKSRRYSER